MCVVGDRTCSSANAWQRKSRTPPCLFSLSDGRSEDPILVDFHAQCQLCSGKCPGIHQPARQLQGHLTRCYSRLYSVPRVPRPCVLVLVLPETWDNLGSSSKLGKARLSPFKRIVSGSWMTLQLPQLLTDPRKKACSKEDTRRTNQRQGKGFGEGECPHIL